MYGPIALLSNSNTETITKMVIYSTHGRLPNYPIKTQCFQYFLRVPFKKRRKWLNSWFETWNKPKGREKKIQSVVDITLQKLKIPFVIGWELITSFKEKNILKERFCQNRSAHYCMNLEDTGTFTPRDCGEKIRLAQKSPIT